MGKESTQHKLDRVRAPRVHITYDVETGGGYSDEGVAVCGGCVVGPGGKTQGSP